MKVQPWQGTTNFKNVCTYFFSAFTSSEQFIYPILANLYYTAFINNLKKIKKKNMDNDRNVRS